MVEDDTIKLLNECDAGLKMGTKGIEEVQDKVTDPNLSSILEKHLNEHRQLTSEVQTKLEQYHDEGKDPNPVASAMSWLKTNMKLIKGEADQTVADLMTDGCNMGIKSICKYLNKYCAASDDVKQIAKKIIHVEEDFMIDLRTYL